MDQSKPAAHPAQQPARTLEPRFLRTCLSRFVTGVAVVSYLSDGQPRGLTVNSFTSVSMDPPLILVSLARSAKACDQLNDTPFVINVLRASQIDVAMQFAGRPKPGAPIRWITDGPDQPPLLAGALATFRCIPWRAYDGGDHVLQVGEVVAAEVGGEEEPLLFDRGRFAMVGLSLFDSPRMVDLDQPQRQWITHTNRVHHIATAV